MFPFNRDIWIKESADETRRPSRFFNLTISAFWGALIILLFGGGATFLIYQSAADFKIDFHLVTLKERIAELVEPEETEKEKPKFKFMYTPVAIDMEKIKNQGCVADGILSGYGKDTGNSVEMINRSNCVYLHRALETWADSPDFEKASEVMSKIQRNDVVYGMFLAEALKKNADFHYRAGDRDFDFSDMCQDNTEDTWGWKTCKADLGSREYRKYLKYITREAMDLGIQSFLFGQIYYQESDSGLENSKMPEIIKEMRAYAQEKNMDIIIGAQTGTITNEKYIRMFDYIEGGIGMGEDGWVENGPCWSHKESCWALLWHKNYASRANNVLVHLDWSGLEFDDMSVFARMDKKRRADTLERLYHHFTSKKVGFLLPLMATLHKENGGCYGPKKGFYSASQEYSCQDEEAINFILKKNSPATVSAQN